MKHLTRPPETRSEETAALGLPVRAGHTTVRRLKGVWPFIGPAFVASVAYIDPGNFATNIAGGSEFGYRLLWVVLSANLLAILIQTLSAKLGIASGRGLARVCRDELPRPVATPAFAERYCTSIAIRFATTMTQASVYPNRAPAVKLVAKLPGSM